MDANTPKWTEIEHLPEWDEEYYLVYTAKKHGKWLMLKTLRPEYKDKPEYEEMIAKEFEVRYNLAHPHIIMINDFEEVPGLGMCIITDDVYGDSLAKLIHQGKVTREHVEKLHNQLLDAIDYIQANHIEHHPIDASRVIFTENIGNLKLIDVGYNQKKVLSDADTAGDILNYGILLTQALDALDPEGSDPSLRRLRRVAAKCTNPDPTKRFRTLSALRLALTPRRTNVIYIIIIAFLLAMIGILLWLNSSSRPGGRIASANAPAEVTVTVTTPQADNLQHQ